jgi:excisionase family DNA binding protein
MSTTNDTKQETLLSVKDVAEWLGVRPAKIYEMERNDTGPRCIRIGKLIKFRREAVIEWLENSET